MSILENKRVPDIESPPYIHMDYSDSQISPAMYISINPDYPVDARA